MFEAIVLAAAIGVTYEVQDSERLKNDVGYKVSVGNEHYAWGSYSTPSVQLMGQNLAKVELVGAGLGVRESRGRWSGFAEIGYFWSDEPTTKDSIRNEAITAALRADHGRFPFHPTQTTYELGNAIGARVGASYALSEHVSTSLSYRILKLEEGYDACTGNDGSCDFPEETGHWQNRKTLDFSAFELGVSLVF